MAGKRTLAVGLDAGSAYTRAVALELHDSSLRFVAAGEVDSIGWNRGRIQDAGALSACIQGAVQQVEQVGRITVDSLTAGVGSSVLGFDNRGTYKFARPHQVTAEDLSYAVEQASDVHLETNRCLLHVFPQDFTLDGRAFHRYPKGATCTRIDANVHVLTAGKEEHETLLQAIHNAHFSVEDTVHESVAAAYASILPEERLRGVLLLNIGRDSSEIVVYEGDALLLAKSLAVSGDHMTRDVAYGLTISWSDAERLKREYGCAMLGLTADNSLIELPSAEGRPPREAPRRQLNDILEARAEQLFHFVRKELDAIGKTQGLLEGVLLTGGGAMLAGMCDLAERVLNLPARNGLATGIEDWPDELNNPSWTTAAGLAMYSARIRMRAAPRPKASGLMGLVTR